MAKRVSEPAIPSTMMAAVINRTGGPSVFKVRELPTPEPESNQVLIAIHTAGIGSWDAQMRDGEYAPSGQRRFPRVLGLDGSGTVVAKGNRVRRFRVGDRVWAYDFENAGFYAQYVAVDDENVGHVPRRMSLRSAGAAAVTGLTALQGVVDTAEIRRGETVLVFGATGTVGTLAVQFAKWRGATVIATATGRNATKLVRSLGARKAIDARSRDAADALAEAAPDGVDVVLAFAGGRQLERLLELVPRGGRVVYPSGVEPEPEKHAGIRLRSYDAAVGPDNFAKLARATETARLKVPVAGTYPLSQAARAHRRLKEGVLGRLVLAVRRD
jgi:NADPH:quinone reductase-like Zn-dependent oxidoreductase